MAQLRLKGSCVVVRKNVFVLLLGLLVVFAVGCGVRTGESDETGFFAVLVDQSGREVVIEELPERIVSISPGNTEMLFFIGLGEKVVGVTDFCNYPEEALAKDKVGGFSKPNLEALVELEPDLVLAGNMHAEIVAKLEEFGIPVLVLSPGSVNDVFHAMELVAEAAGTDAKGAIGGMRERLDKVREALAAVPEGERFRVYYEVYSEPLMSAGGLSLINEVLTLGGGINIFADVAERYPKISQEAVVERDPQFILYPGFHGSEEIKGDILTGRPVWRGITAVKEGRVLSVRDDAVSRPGPRLVDGVEEVARILYPDLFK